MTSHCCNMVYRHVGGNYYRQNDVTVIPFIIATWWAHKMWIKNHRHCLFVSISRYSSIRATSTSLLIDTQPWMAGGPQMDTIGKLWYGSRRLEILLLAVDIRGDSVATRATKTCGSFVRPCRQSMWQLVQNGEKILSTYLTEHQKLYYTILCRHAVFWNKTACTTLLFLIYLFPILTLIIAVVIWKLLHNRYKNANVTD